MAFEMRVLIVVVAMVVCLPSAVYAEQGTVTFYTPAYVPSSCNGYQNDGVLIAAASAPIFNNKAACGRSYRVTCTGATNQGVPQPCKGTSVVVKIVDLCPSPGCQATLDLSQEAFATIANPDAGKITIEYNQV
ncbi:EG45-like domain containing protein [Prunus persica]|uniref:EG45-like domain containing protein n=1 Tax=Prunus persica TaxID=3760 RepID=UPI0009AB78AF|nr:EG45-like domain containing protein [Prunus persica]